MANITSNGVTSEKTYVSAEHWLKADTREQELVLLIAEYFVGWVEIDGNEKDDRNMSFSESMSSIESYGIAFDNPCEMLVTNAIRHFKCVAKPIVNEHLCSWLVEIGFIPEEVDRYWCNTMLCKNIVQKEMMSLSDIYLTTEKYSVRGCIKTQDNDIESGPQIPRSEVQFWSVYKNMPSGEQHWIRDFDKEDEAVEFKNILKESVRSHYLGNAFRPTLHLDWLEINRIASSFLTEFLGREIRIDSNRYEYYCWNLVVCNRMTEGEMDTLHNLVESDEYARESQSFEGFPTDVICDEISIKLFSLFMPFEVSTSRADDDGVWFIGY